LFNNFTLFASLPRGTIAIPAARSFYLTPSKPNYSSIYPHRTTSNNIPL
jgi:hypothetical protein